MTTHGAAADAAGLETMTGLEDLREIHDVGVNATRDQLAIFMTTGVWPAARISGTLDPDRIPSGLDESKVAAAGSVVKSGHALVWDAGVGTWRFDTRLIGNTSIEAVGLLRGAGIWANDITTTRRTVWMDSDGYLGWASSSEAGKVNIHPATIDPRAILAVDVMLFNRRAEVEKAGPDGHVPTEVGMIAERLHEAGLWMFVLYDDDHETPVGILYEFWALAVHVVTQWLAQRVDDLEATSADKNRRLTELENRLDRAGVPQ